MVCLCFMFVPRFFGVQNDLAGMGVAAAVDGCEIPSRHKLKPLFVCVYRGIESFPWVSERWCERISHRFTDIMEADIALDMFLSFVLKSIT